VELGENGYKSGEWFCRDFSDTGRANRRALAHLRQVRGLLDPGILYGFYGSDGRLKERLLRSLGSDDEGESGKEG
jgi:hypothetical protein